MAARRISWLGTFFAIVLAAGVAFSLGWVTKTLLAPPKSLPPAAQYTVATVERGTLGRLLNINVAVEWKSSGAIISPSAGTLTEKRAAEGARIQSGDAIYSINLEQVFVAKGEIPAFRDMKLDDRGADVAQLQRFLSDELGVQLTADGHFGHRTEQAVKQWQKNNQLEETGEIHLGRIIFTPHMPIALMWADDMPVGTPVVAGDTVATIINPTPIFSVVLPSGHLAFTQTGMPVEITSGENLWRGIVGPITIDSDGNGKAEILSEHEDITSICAEQCGTLTVGSENSLAAKLVVQPEQEGILLPTSALSVGVDGSIEVTTESGQRQPITVKISLGGRSLVEGIEAGTRIRVPLTNSSDNDPMVTELTTGSTAPMTTQE